MEVTTLDKIKKISMRLFNERNYEGTSLKDIFNEIGISAPSFYYYYPSKKDLYVDLMKNAQEEHKKLLLETLEGVKNKKTKERFYEVVKFFVRYSIENREESDFIFREAVFPNYEFVKDLEKTSKAWQSVYSKAIEEIVKDGKKKGELHSSFDNKVIVDAFFSFIIGFGADANRYNIKKTEDIKPYFEVFYRSVAA